MLHNLNFYDKSYVSIICFRNAPPKSYAADMLAHKYGHSVLRLPPYHCIFNPIENVWGITKEYYNKHIGRDGNGAAKALDMWKEALDKVTPQIWKNAIQHAEKEIQTWWDREIVFDREDVQPLIININWDSDDSSCCDGDDSD